jgi:hypothetical protein
MTTSPTHASFRTWLRRHVVNSDAPPTHVSIGGGKYHVADADHDAFLERYIAAARAGEPTGSLVEIKTPVFRMFVDIDMRDNHELNRAERDDLVRDVCKSVCEAFPAEHAPRAVVSETPPKHEEGGIVKTGIHVVWPDLKVKSSTALMIAAKVSHDLKTAYGPKGVGNDWNDVIDRAVLRDGGAGSLRLNGAPKPNDDRSYHAVYELRGSEDKTDVEDPWSVLKDCCVRIPGTDPQTPTTPFDEDAVREALVDAEEDEVLQQRFCDQGDLETVETSADLREFLCKAFPKHEVGAGITKVRRVKRSGGKKGGALLVNVNSRFCTNKGSKHKSNHIFFYVAEKGAAQRCFKCSEFEGPYKKLPPKLKKEIFPEEKIRPPSYHNMTNEERSRARCFDVLRSLK